MRRNSVFIQECPICGRPLEIRGEYQHKKVACPHCGGWFTAVNALSNPLDVWNQSNHLLHRADQLLEECVAGSQAMN
jgi:transposase